MQEVRGEKGRAATDSPLLFRLYKQLCGGIGQPCGSIGNGKVEGDPEAIAHVEEELGDVLFSLVNVARRMGVNSENALRASCRKFRTRWSAMEQSAFEQGVRLEDMTCEEQNRLWEQVKADLRK